MGGGEPLLGIPSFLPYPQLFQGWLPGRPADWYDPDSGAMLFPFRTLAAAVGLVVLPLASRLTARWDPPQRLRQLEA